MSLSETQRELLSHLEDMTRGLRPDDLSRFTTTRIAQALSISRTHVSECLNDLVRRGLVVKAGRRPTHYFHRPSLERLFQVRLGEGLYASVDDLLEMRCSLDTLGFEGMVGHDGSLGPSIEQVVSALEYPTGLPVLLVGESGSGKTMLARRAYEYARERGIVRPDARFQVIECSSFQGDAPGFAEALLGAPLDHGGQDAAVREGAAYRASGGIVFLRNVEALSAASVALVLSLLADDLDVMPSGALEGHPRFRLFMSTDCEPTSDYVRTAARRVPVVVPVPSLRDRPVYERERLALHFLRLEGRRLGSDVRMARGALRLLAAADFDDSVRGLRSCVTNVCAEAFCRRSSSCLEIRAYQLPPDVLHQNTGERRADDESMIDVSEDLDGGEDHQLIEPFSSALALARRFFDGEISKMALMEGIEGCMHSVEDCIVFGGVAANSRAGAFEHVLSGIISEVNESYGIDLTKKMVLLAARVAYLQSWPGARLGQWEKGNAREIHRLFLVLSKRWRLSCCVLDRICSEMARSLGVNLSPLMRIPLLVELGAYESSVEGRLHAGIVLSHGYATASSIADTANRMLRSHVFEAIDMSYDQEISDVVGPLRKTLARLSHCREVAVLVDMGSLEGVRDFLPVPPGMTLGVINNASTSLAVEVGAGLVAGEGLGDILARAAEACKNRYGIFEGTLAADAVVLCSGGGSRASEKIKELVSQSLEQDVALRFVSADPRQLEKNGLRDSVFSRYRVCAVVGTVDPRLPDIPFVALEEFIVGNRTQADLVLSDYMTPEELLAFHQNLVKNLALRNVVDAITILNPTRLLEEVEEAVDKLASLAGERLDERTLAGLYVHLCCMVERLVTHSPIQTHPGESLFERERAEFVTAFKESFARMAEHYRVEIPVAEIAYVWDYIRSASDGGLPKGLLADKGDSNDF